VLFVHNDLNVQFGITNLVKDTSVETHVSIPNIFRFFSQARCAKVITGDLFLYLLNSVN
jgi:hypothetical protein